MNQKFQTFNYTLFFPGIGAKQLLRNAAPGKISAMMEVGSGLNNNW
jgi:hypothetical protein